MLPVLDDVSGSAAVSEAGDRDGHRQSYVVT